MTVATDTLAILFPLLLLLSWLGFTVVIDPYISKEQRRIMLSIVMICFSLIVQNYWEDKLFISHSGWVFKNILSAYGYAVRPVILILFLHVVFPEGKRVLQWALAGINAALYFSSPFTKLCFEIRKADFASLRGSLWYTCFLISGVLLLELLIRTIIRYRETKKLELLIPVSAVLIIVISVVLDMNVGMEQQPVTYLTISVVVSSVFYYIWLHFQFVREHEQDLVAAQRIQIMMSQIQPHFLYNTLTTIQALCETNPEKASDITEKFGVYLRQNIDSIDSNGLISFDKEMEHTMTYADIEMVRFPNIRLVKDIEDHDFVLPALTVQPIVENAIRHGVRIRKQGIVSVSTRRKTDCHEIIIADNGKGFDTENKALTAGNHIGIRNVRDRIEQMCGGSFIIESVPGEGTRVTIRIPAKESETRA